MDNFFAYCHFDNIFGYSYFLQHDFFLHNISNVDRAVKMFFLFKYLTKYVVFFIYTSCIKFDLRNYRMHLFFEFSQLNAWLKWPNFWIEHKIFSDDLKKFWGLRFLGTFWGIFLFHNLLKIVKLSIWEKSLKEIRFIYYQYMINQSLFMQHN